jgi:hypothetical protein
MGVQSQPFLKSQRRFRIKEAIRDEDDDCCVCCGNWGRSAAIGSGRSVGGLVRATYGTNYGNNDECNKINDTQGDYTELLKAECDGKSNCSYGKIGEKGDHCPDKRKAFDYFWICTSRSGQTEKEGHIAPEASGKVANLSCP